VRPLSAAQKNVLHAFVRNHESDADVTRETDHRGFSPTLSEIAATRVKGAESVPSPPIGEGGLTHG
jgi:hypothetical protein